MLLSAIKNCILPRYYASLTEDFSILLRTHVNNLETIKDNLRIFSRDCTDTMSRKAGYDGVLPSLKQAQLEESDVTHLAQLAEWTRTEMEAATALERRAFQHIEQNVRLRHVLERLTSEQVSMPVLAGNLDLPSWITAQDTCFTVEAKLQQRHEEWSRTPQRAITRLELPPDPFDLPGGMVDEHSSQRASM